ncbi:MAG: methylmalonyl-CoA carboxyltransferase [Hyphomicrobium sp.]|nr:methylmalonyl-CoA carboxyltransferase [Hyphomicrobium sp.]
MTTEKKEQPLNDFEERRRAALAMGGEAKLRARAEKGVLDARSRIDRLIDPGSFYESGLFGRSIMPGDEATTPADGKIAGYARIDGREVAVISNDFTVKGASSSLTNMRKIGQMRRIAAMRGLPMVWLGESSGARLPDNQGSRGMGTMLGNDPTQYQRMRETPWVSAILGYCYGSSFLYNCCSDFSVIRKGAVMAVSSPGLIELATGEKLSPEDLGGWRIHAETTGMVDMVVDTDEEALDALRKFLSYMPTHHKEMPPVRPAPAGSGEGMRTIQDLLPASRTQVYDMRKIIQRIVDNDSYFEMKARFGRVAVTALGRLAGRVVGIIANNPMVKGGTLDTDACDKIIDFLVLCDSFNIPIVMLVDTPGFLIGAEAEKRRATGKIVNFMNALQLVTVPKISVIIRKTYGQAYLNMGGGRNSDEVAAWPTAEVSFMTPAFAVTVVHGLRRGDPGFEEKLAEMEKENEVWGIASMYGVQHVIQPQETRDHLIRLLDVHQLRLSNGIGQHLMRAWPTSS